MSNAAIESLLKKRHELIAERDKVMDSFYKTIKEVEDAIEVISGRKVKEVIGEFRYDDENPDYIRGTEDGV